MKNIITNTFQNRNVRTVLIENEPWFIAKDVAEILGYVRKDNRVDTNAMIRKLDNDDVLEIADDFSSSSNMSRKLLVINESGLYNSIFGSKLESAKQFKLWVTREVLPSIRKTGNYSIDSSESSQPKENIDLDEILVISKKMLELASMFGLSRESRYISADRGVKRVTGNSPLDLLGISQRVSFEDMPII